jgi:Flp pilus assembly protein TadG
LKRYSIESFNNSKDRFRGQALVEFALALPVLLLLIFGVLEFGRAFTTKIAMENAAREGAHYYIYDIADDNNSFVNTKTAVKWEANNQGLSLQDSDITVKCVNGGVDQPDCDPGDTIVVTVTQTFGIAVFDFILNNLDMVSEARMMVP